MLRRVQRFAASLAAPIVESELEEGALGHGGVPRVAGELAAPCCGGNSLICHRGLPLLLRLALPIVLVAAVGIYLSAHTHVGATVDITMALVGDAPIQIPRLFAFSLGNTVHDMWQAGVYPLAFLVALLSGGWPYLKVRTASHTLARACCGGRAYIYIYILTPAPLRISSSLPPLLLLLPPLHWSPTISKVILMFLCWTVPFSDDAFVLTPEMRARTLRWLDALGKWSLIDAYLLILFMVAFRFHITEKVSVYNVILYIIVVWIPYMLCAPPLVITCCIWCESCPHKLTRSSP